MAAMFELVPSQNASRVLINTLKSEGGRGGRTLDIQNHVNLFSFIYIFCSHLFT